MKNHIKIIFIICMIYELLTGCSCKTKNGQELLINGGHEQSMGNTITIDKISNNYIKSLHTANPISGEIFCADPTAIEYKGRLYVYATNDHQQYETVGDNGKNDYMHIKSMVVFSTDDMKNWTYHGIIDVESIAPWIINSWAPSIVSRVEEDGLTHFYMYFSNNGCGVGVITATNPLGPWSDPLGRPLISVETLGLADCPNPFDPGVCIDENGVGWLSFGGGRAKNGTDFMPGSARIVRLGEDMISFDSNFVEIKAPYFFEASELNYINGTYVYTYNSSWDKRTEWNSELGQAPSACSMVYMTTSTPLIKESWVYRGEYFPNPGTSGLEYSNNHTHLHKYKDKYYVFHHTLLKQANMTTKGGFRSIGVVEVPVDEKSIKIAKVKPDVAGVSQIKSIDPTLVNEGECFFTSAGIEFVYDENKLVSAIKSIEQGANICVKQVYFKKDALKFFMARVKGAGRLELRLDDPSSTCIAAIEFESENYIDCFTEVRQVVEGAHDLFLVFSNGNIDLDHWQFS